MPRAGLQPPRATLRTKIGRADAEDMLVRRMDYHQSARTIWRAYNHKYGRDSVRRLVSCLEFFFSLVEI